MRDLTVLYTVHPHLGSSLKVIFQSNARESLETISPHCSYPQICMCPAEKLHAEGGQNRIVRLRCIRERALRLQRPSLASRGDPHRMAWWGLVAQELIPLSDPGHSEEPSLTFEDASEKKQSHRRHQR